MIAKVKGITREGCTMAQAVIVDVFRPPVGRGQAGGAITVGNCSPFTDGASDVLIVSEERAGELGLRPRAGFRLSALTGDDLLMMLTGPIPAGR
jgi:acetyl-CoA acetyltransferase